MLAVHHVVHADDQRTAELLAVGGSQSAQLLGLLGGHLADRQGGGIRAGLLVARAVEDQGDDVRV